MLTPFCAGRPPPFAVYELLVERGDGLVDASCLDDILEEVVDVAVVDRLLQYPPQPGLAAAVQRAVVRIEPFRPVEAALLLRGDEAFAERSQTLIRACRLGRDPDNLGPSFLFLKVMDQYVPQGFGRPDPLAQLSTGLANTAVRAGPATENRRNIMAHGLMKKKKEKARLSESQALSSPPTRPIVRITWSAMPYELL